ncbi:MAG: twin-arginine translocase subunit TatC [bacterium]|nr:twin-arginine translocase subunit TatC [bacterium]MCP4799399.1 twin-arginine translocase subunit TatC [bacterium]
MTDTADNKETTKKDMSFLDHLDELRSVLIAALAALVVVSGACWFFSKPLLDMLVGPISAIDDNNVYFLQPAEAFLTRMKLALACGSFIILPYVLWRIYHFIMPGLHDKERRFAVPLLLATVSLFYLGVAFAYIVLVPKVIAFMLSFGTTSMLPMISIGSYFAFVARLCLAFGMVFELPLVVFLLSVLGVVNPVILLRGWRFALIGIVIFSAVLTPPDVISQLIMAGPVMVLYISSVLISMAVTRKRRKKKSDEE